MNYVFDFNHPHALPPRDLKVLLGGKGVNLAEMVSVLGLPVPPGFTISTEACRHYRENGWPESLSDELAQARRRLEVAMGAALGDGDNPLLVAVRSGAQFSMPGMLDTVLNLGLNDESVRGLAAQTGDERFAYDSYRRFIAMYGRIVLGISGEHFDTRFELAKERSQASSDSEVSISELLSVCEDFKAKIADVSGEPFPQDPSDQLRGAIEAVFSSWDGLRAQAYRAAEGIDDHLGTAVNVQVMVFGNRDNQSGTGVGFTRNPVTGAQQAYGDFLVNAQGEDVVAGIRTTEDLLALENKFPRVHAELLAIFQRLEAHYRDMCDTEFTIEQGRLWMLQTRVGKRTGRAALRMAVEMTRDPSIALSREEAILRVSGDHIVQVLHPQLTTQGHEALTWGLGASPGAAVGRAYFTAEAAVAAVSRGEAVVLVRSETSPDDVHGMLAAEGILTSLGGVVSHAAVVARGWGKPAVVGAERVRISGSQLHVDDHVISEGEWLSLDGSTGAVYRGQLDLEPAEPSAEFDLILSWADEVRSGRLSVRANADTAEDARRARELGADGIGLCRTEHMFLREDRLGVVRRMILATSSEQEQSALDELGKVQEEDFGQILEAMDGLPVTVRLLDPPLHEFLPSVQELRVKKETIGLNAEERALLEAAQAWEEVNPMLGTRGVRLGVVKPGLYEMQVQAVVRAALRRRRQGGSPKVEIMIPLTVSAQEFKLARQWVVDAIADAGSAGELEILIGTMVETPRAALVAGALAEHADFFSFGTNDLTQMTFGFSRDDIESSIMGPYLAADLLEHNPFEVLDQEGVGALIRGAVEQGRAVKPDLKMGICGEHGGEPQSIEFCFGLGLDYVSCSPFRVPVARLAGAHAVLGSEGWR